MAYAIKEYATHIEVNLSAGATKLDVMAAIGELAKRDPAKEMADVWTVEPGFDVPYEEYAEVADAIGHVFPARPVSRKSAIVAADNFQKAQFEMYRTEVAGLPMDLRLFVSLEEAVAWVAEPEAPVPA